MLYRFERARRHPAITSDFLFLPKFLYYCTARPDATAPGGIGRADESGSKRMEKTRLEMLAEALEASPENAFLRYGLAMELKNAGHDEDALKHFEHLLTHHPDYWATYLHAGLLLAKMHRPDDARRVMMRGVEVTGRLNNQHARSELESALEDLDS